MVAACGGKKKNLFVSRVGTSYFIRFLVSYNDITTYSYLIVVFTNKNESSWSANRVRVRARVLDQFPLF
jgi:hypothetical protein